jgi:hypothetical protein
LQVEPAGGAQVSEQEFMQVRPDSGLGPVPQTTPTGHSGTADQPCRELGPADPGLEHEDDSGQRDPVIDRLTAWMAVPAGRTSGQQRRYPPP